MKSYFKILLGILLVLMATNILVAQNYCELKYSPELLLGKWKATSGDMTYEVEFISEVISNKKNDQMEFVLGRITYKRDSVIIKKTEYNKLKSAIYGNMKSSKKGDMEFSDEELLGWWYFEFIIDDNNNNKAVWKFLRPHDDWMEMGWNEENLPDIPDNLVFRKMVTPTNPDGLDPGHKM